ncbi:MAG: rhodanese-like domain-containing protein [Gammaproteobacteria bacterium]|nr:rhodanese-like domain-containing protein [Gammaproteobacteria bacterium]
MIQQFNYQPAAQVNQLMLDDASVHLIDVRTRAEFDDGHAKGAQSIPLDELNRDSLNTDLNLDSIDDHSFYLICQGGHRAKLAAEKLSEQGVSNLVVVKGGTDAWNQSNLPMLRHSRLPSLERQTQIAIGGLLLLVLIKGMLIHPAFNLLIGAVAIGLIVAGVTARCSLTSILARMPWNQRHSGSPA